MAATEEGTHSVTFRGNSTNDVFFSDYRPNSPALQLEAIGMTVAFGIIMFVLGTIFIFLGITIAMVIEC